MPDTPPCTHRARSGFAGRPSLQARICAPTLGPDAVVLQEKSLAIPDTNFTFDLRRGEIHDWAMTSWLPEARAVRSQIYHQLGV
jgi:hypothetical protein